ncbi:MAG: DUF2490 domain-containing protein [Gemmatimonadaceae bacterium]|nr:DUF2490 domain-containing protein [Gemmatimonadaceae bacterium]
MRSRPLLLLLGALLAAPSLPAQPWTTRHQDALWVGAFVDQPLTKRAAFWFDGSWRRMDLGDKPQQLLLRPGLQWTLTPGVRVAAGAAYIATAPYGSLPAANPSRETRLWQQLLLTHKAGRVAVTQRYRLEQRWIHPLVPSTDVDDEDGVLVRGRAAYQNRLRYMGRGQIDLPGVRLATRPVFAYAWDELLMPLGGPNQTFTIGQNRASVGVGLPVSATMRAEVGYMNLYNAFAARRANEINHTLWVSWHYTGKARR